MLSLSPLFNLFFVVMFSSLGLFKEVACPEQAHCILPNCIFDHQPSLESATEPSEQSTSSPLPENNKDCQHSNPPKKRRRLVKGHEEIHPNGLPVATATIKLPQTARRDVSPPPLRDPRNGDGIASSPASKSTKQSSTTSSKSNAASQSSQNSTELSLNPRMLSKPPAAHAVRIQLITMLHEHMRRLNEEVKKSDHPSKTILQLSSQALIAQALSEEEKLAIDNAAVYSNVIKLRIVKLKKMRAADWIEERLKQIAKSAAAKGSSKPTTAPKVIETGLTSDEEIAFLPRLFADQSSLAQHGYVTAPVSDIDIEEARRGVEAAQGWEQCDRCKTRFQVFPGRREEDGALTSGGQCVHHPGKPRRPTAQDNQDRADRAVRELFYTCCNEAVSVSSGCATAATHVFKVSEAKRLALTMPFETTPPNHTSSSPKAAVCFDCEMGYTAMGLELIRLTATSWPSGSSLLDILVRPLGEILDLNSRFSGVWPKDFASALPYDPSTTSSQDPTTTPLRIVSSPAAARSLLFAHLHPDTPLIGHALDNDLNSARIIHPSIIDTVLLYPHPKGLPLRLGLKALMKKHLDCDIQ